MKKLLNRIFSRQDELGFVTIVSGLPRSGTSMMMRMLEAGGMPIVIDNIRQADSDNPRGYYEFEKVKKMKEDDSWLEMCHGKAIKIISALLKELPEKYEYRIIFMRREMREILASQKVMLERRGEVAGVISDQEMATKFERYLREVEEWIKTQDNISVMYIKYNEVVKHPYDNAETVSRFLDGIVEPEKMVSVIERGLYRQKTHTTGHLVN